MKKLKKILSVISAAMLCTLPMVNGVVSNADSEAKHTYKICCDVPRNSGIKRAGLTINFDNMKLNLQTLEILAAVLIPHKYDSQIMSSLVYYIVHLK